MSTIKKIEATTVTTFARGSISLSAPTVLVAEIIAQAPPVPEWFMPGGPSVDFPKFTHLPEDVRKAAGLYLDYGPSGNESAEVIAAANEMEAAFAKAREEEAALPAKLREFEARRFFAWREEYARGVIFSTLMEPRSVLDFIKID